MEVIVPSSLLGLPEPWRNLKMDPEEELVDNNCETRAAALQVLDCCLKAVGDLPDFVPEEFPDFVTVGWSLWASSFATFMPTFDEFSLELIAEAFRRQAPDINDSVVCRYAQAWLRKQALDLAGTAQSYLFDSLHASPDTETLGDLYRIVKHRWQVDSSMAFSLLHDLWLLDRAGSAVLMTQVSSSPDAEPKLATQLKQLLTKQ